MTVCNVKPCVQGSNVLWGIILLILNHQQTVCCVCSRHTFGSMCILQDHQQLARIKLDDDDIGRIEEVLLEGRRIRGDVYNFERKDWAIES